MKIFTICWLKKTSNLNKEISEIRKEMSIFQEKLDQLYKAVMLDNNFDPLKQTKDSVIINNDEDQSWIYYSVQSANRNSLPSKSPLSKEKKLMSVFKSSPSKFEEDKKDCSKLPPWYFIKEVSENDSFCDNAVFEDTCVKLTPYPSSRNKNMPSKFFSEVTLFSAGFSDSTPNIDLSATRNSINT